MRKINFGFFSPTLTQKKDYRHQFFLYQLTTIAIYYRLLCGGPVTVTVSVVVNDGDRNDDGVVSIIWNNNDDDSNGIHRYCYYFFYYYFYFLFLAIVLQKVSLLIIECEKFGQEHNCNRSDDDDHNVVSSPSTTPTSSFFLVNIIILFFIIVSMEAIHFAVTPLITMLLFPTIIFDTDNKYHARISWYIKT